LITLSPDHRGIRNTAREALLAEHRQVYPDLVTETVVETVLTAARPAFTEDEAARLARELFATDGVAVEVDSERDQTFLLDGSRPAVLKISNAAESTEQLDMEAQAAQRVASLDPSLPVALPWRVPGAAGAFRAPIERDGHTHWARMYDLLPGRASVRGHTLTDAAVRDWGTMAARVGRALRGFWHPSAARVMLWDVQHALLLRPMLSAVTDAEVRRLVERALDRFEQEVTPIWPTLRHQLVHTDLCASNVLVDDDGQVSGIIDFGDASWSGLVVDLAAVLETVVEGREEDADEFFRAARLALDGYEKVTPLEPEERQIVGELIAARMCAGIVIPASRAGLYDDPDSLMPHLRGQAVKVLRLFESLGWAEVRRRLGGRAPGEEVSVGALAERRSKAFGPAVTAPTYREPLHLVGGEGVWLIDADGRRFLDAYNNVPVVGHGHPRVVEATVRQARRLNTNARYLHETAIEVAERLIASTGGTLDAVMFVNSGSEANDVAWRIARAATGGSGAITTDWAYHGITEATNALTPEEWGNRPPPEHVRTWRPPDRLRGFDNSLADFERAVDELVEAGHRPAAAILDGVLTSDGIIELPADLAAELVRRTRDAGALWIADEVQGGHGRTGAGMWSYQRLGIEPDFVTIGKPMGNGMPVAALITRRELAQRFSPEGEFFSTFGGNPVAATAALAVLDVIEDEGLIERARDIGECLAGKLRELAPRHPSIGEVRAVGLAIGVEIVRPATTEPDAATTREIVEGMREDCVLIGRTGRHGNTLKIRPPLVFERSHADQLVRTLEGVLQAVTRSAA
jgi:4-aminobutyrate aminotransferase-like enzyme/Ser/Thr protein kinase RdoA (MazF antagonist)